jgi:hypothetical protein
MLWWVAAIIQPMYIVYKLSELYQHPDRFPESVTFPQFFITSVISITVRVVTLVCSVICFRNFGVGLQQQLAAHQEKTQQMRFPYVAPIDRLPTPVQAHTQQVKRSKYTISDEEQPLVSSSTKHSGYSSFQHTQN